MHIIHMSGWPWLGLKKLSEAFMLKKSFKKNYIIPSHTLKVLWSNITDI